jgi:hypothetical protein
MDFIDVWVLYFQYSLDQAYTGVKRHPRIRNGKASRNGRKNWKDILTLTSTLSGVVIGLTQNEKYLFESELQYL